MNAAETAAAIDTIRATHARTHARRGAVKSDEAQP